jgi:PAS domain S-box-containing protein
MMPAMASSRQEFDTFDIEILVDSIPALIHTAKPDGYLDYFNKRWLEYLGVSLDAVAGWKWTAFIHPDDVEGIVSKWRASLASGEIFEYETRVRLANGDYRWMFHRKVPLLDRSGAIVKWYGSSMDIHERKTTEEQLRNNSEELQRSEFYLAEGQRLAHMGSWAFDPQGFSYWSAELFRMHGLDPAGRPPATQEYLAYVHPTDRESISGLIQGLVAGALPFDTIKRIVRPDGEVRYIRCVGAPYADNESPRKYVGSALDVTEHELLTQELRLGQAYLAEAQRLSHTGSWAWNVADRSAVHLSDEWYRIYGFNPTEGAPAWETRLERIHPEDRNKWKDTIERAILEKSDYQVDFRIVLPNGAVRWIHTLGHPVLNDAGDLVQFVGSSMDFTKSKAAEDKIRQQEAELQQIVDFAPQLIAVFGPNWERLYINRIALDYLGTNLEEWMSKKLATADDCHPDDLPQLEASTRLASTSRLAFEIELRLRDADGRFRWFLARFNPVRDRLGQIIRWYCAATDIHERKSAEERLQHENVALREEVDKASMFEEIVGTSPALKRVLSRISKVAPSDSTVLITGETGTGKELVARAIHRRSDRSSRAFVSVNCAAIPRDLIASELFGHEKGAFTGAIQQRIGRFELANGGTLFLDEVGELPPETQIALLRVLQEHEFERVGGTRSIHVDVRVIAATNRDLQAAIGEGSFRSDLFYRLHVFPIPIPPLRERKDDIPLLVEYFIDRFARKSGKHITRVEKRTLEVLQSYPWPGNIRELQNIIERSVIVCESASFSVDESWLSQQPFRSPMGTQLQLADRVAAQEKELIEAALAESQGRVFGPSGAAAKLGIARSTLESKIRSLKINKNRFRA